MQRRPSTPGPGANLGLSQALAARGFDLCVAGPWSSLSSASQASLASSLDGEQGGELDGAELLLTGNTRALWSHFVAHRRAGAPAEPGVDPEFQRAHPLDAYTEQVHRALAPQGCSLRFAHQVSPALPFQRLAAELGLCESGPAGLSVHWEYGPWFAVRGLYIFPRGILGGRPPSAGQPGRLKSHCAGCRVDGVQQPCKLALARALEVTKTLDRGGVAGAFEAWLAVRDACPIGRQHRYTSAQLRFHYGVDAAG